jgi:hypothetical protein
MRLSARSKPFIPSLKAIQNPYLNIITLPFCLQRKERKVFSQPTIAHKPM